MAKRNLVYVQVKNKEANRWHNYKGYKTYEDAVNGLNELSAKYPDAILRVLENNLVTHTTAK